MTTDWSGRKYRILKALGENIDMICGVYQPQFGTMRWFLHSHELDDGGGAITKILSTLSVQTLQKPRAAPRSRPGLIQQLAALRLHIQNSRPVDYPWRKLNASPGVETGSFVYLMLSSDLGEQVRHHACTYGVGETTFFLASLDKVCRQRCLTHESERVWLLPHDFRRALGVTAPTGNWTAPLSLRLKGSPTAQDMSSQLRSLYGRRILWGSWLYTNFARWLSEGLIRRTYNRLKGRAWFGVYANMGHWRAVTTDAARLADAWIVSAPPVSAVCPITAGSFTWEGRTGFTLQLHESLNADPDACMLLMRDWIADIFQAADIREPIPEPHCISIDDIARQARRVDTVTKNVGP